MSTVKLTLSANLTRISAALLVAASLLGAACGGGSDDSDEPGEQVDDQPEATSFNGTAVEAVESFDLDDIDESIARLNDVMAADAVVVSDLAPSLEAEDPGQRWAALYIVAFLTETEEDIETLMPVLDDEELAFRVIAAASLFGVGVAEAFPVLVEGLSTDEFLPYRDYPRLVSDLAREALEYYTGQSHSTVAEWEEWWESVESEISWDGEIYVSD